MIIRTCPDPWMEALSALARIAARYTQREGESHLMDLHDAQARFLEQGMSAAEREELFAGMTELFQKIEAGCDAQVAELQKYFGLLDDGETVVAEVLNYASNLFDALPALSRAEQDEAVRLLALSSFREDLPQNLELTELSRALAAGPLSDGDRWRLMELSLDWPQMMTRVNELLARCTAIFEANQQLVQPLVDDCVRRLQSDEKTLLRSGTIEFHLGQEDIVQPAVFFFDAISMRDNDMVRERFGYREPFVLKYGVLCDRLNEIHVQRADSQEYLLRGLKAADDKTRLQILIALKRKPLAGHEVAELTGLSAATVSHHLNVLYNANLITMERRGTSIFCSLRPSGVEALVEMLRAELL